MTRSQSIQRLWIIKTRPHLPTRLHLPASARCRMDLLLEHSRRRNHYQAYPTRLRSQDQTAIKEYLAVSDNNSAIVAFLSSVAFVHGITGYKFKDRHLLLQALYGDPASEHPHQRLALLGDTLLQYILKDDWFRLNLPTSRIGGIVNQLATNANLADAAKETGLVRHLGFLEPRIRERTNDHVLGTIVEALLGAIHEDSGKDMEAVRRAMHMMGLKLPRWYTEKSMLYQPESQNARSELNQHDLRSQSNQSDLPQASSESHPILIQKQQPAKKPNRRERKRLLETLHKPQEKVDQGLSEHKDLDEGSFGYRYQITNEQATSDEDLEALDSAPERLYDMGTYEEIGVDYGAEHAVLEDADSEQTHLRDGDANQMGFETSATYQESIEPTAAEFTTSSWRELMRGSGDSQREPETMPKQKRATSPVTDFDTAMGAMMLEDSGGSPMEHEIVGGSEWPVRHGWFPQRCQITLDAALPKDPDAKQEVAACEPDLLLAASPLDSVVPPETPHSTKKPHTTNEVPACEPDRLLAAPTLDDIALPKLPTTKEVAAYEPDRLRLTVAPCKLNRLMAAL